MFQFSAGDRLRAPDDEVVRQHATNHCKNQAEVELANPADGLAADIGRERRVDVHLRRRELFRDSWMALSTGARKVRGMDRGARITRWKNAMRPMATGAVGNDLRSQPRCQSVIAREISG